MLLYSNDVIHRMCQRTRTKGDMASVSWTVNSNGRMNDGARCRPPSWIFFRKMYFLKLYIMDIICANFDACITIMSLSGSTEVWALKQTVMFFFTPQLLENIRKMRSSCGGLFADLQDLVVCSGCVVSLELEQLCCYDSHTLWVNEATQTTSQWEIFLQHLKGMFSQDWTGLPGR